MSILFLELIAILIFVKFADFKRMRELIPVILTAMFLRFLEHYIVIDWLKIWVIPGPYWKELWLPISADITIWPISCYLFIQYYPKIKRLLYLLVFTGVLFVYLLLLKWLHVFEPIPQWKMYYSIFIIMIYFYALYLIWRWLRGKSVLQV